jgi:hypothetical protein
LRSISGTSGGCSGLYDLSDYNDAVDDVVNGFHACMKGLDI